MSNSVQVLGDFELIRELGRGGMGIVYEARQVSLNRKVALKVLKAGLGLTTQAVNRFQREAAAAAKLHHTNIVPIYATGQDGEYHFYAMELIEGSSLDRIIRTVRLGKSEDRNPRSEGKIEGRVPNSKLERAQSQSSPAATTLADRPGATKEQNPPHLGETTTTLSSGSGYYDQGARMFAEVADGLEHAHGQRVIHRDIKPSNLLVSPQGRLHLTDFGLARVLEEPGMTVTGEFMGSPLYMSPEQIAAGRALLDHRTDIYSLGATLYEALTLRPPFQGDRRDQIIAQVLHKEPKPPRAIDRKIPPDLETICLKAMDKDPDRRYRTAGALAEDLRRFVNRFAIEARRANVVQRTVKWARRHPGIAVAAGTAVAALLLVGVFARQTQLARRRLLEEKRQAVIQDAVLAARGGDLDQAEKDIDEAERLHASPGEIRLLRGQVALNQMHATEAVRHLEQAIQLLPGNLSAHALLATAYFFAGQWERAYRASAELDRFKPASAEDFLFKGQAESFWDPKQSLEIINEGIRQGDSIMARLVRADARNQYATLTGDPADVRLAQEDIQTARSMKPGNPAVLITSFNTRLAAALIYADRGLQSEREHELQLAEQEYHAMESLQSALAAYERGHYWEERGDERAALREWEHYIDVPDSGWAVHNCIPILYREGNFEKALALSEKIAMGPSVPCYTLAELPDGPRRAYERFQTSAKASFDGWTAIESLNTLLFLARGAEATAGFQALQQHFHDAWRDHWHERLVAYEAGQLTEAQLLEAIGTSQWNMCEGQFCIGLKHLSQRDRAGARQHFQKSAATPLLGWHENQWSRCFLSRMAANPKWPPWIPVKADTAAQTDSGQKP
jgi:serine/threonine protein kinase